MSLTPDWQHLLTQPAEGSHIVQVYQDEAFLAQSVGHFMGTGLRQAEGVIVIATFSHGEAFIAELGAQGFDVAEALHSGQLTILDAEQTMALFMRNGMPNWKAFQDAIVPIIEQMQTKFHTIRAYGEMVDVLWQQGEYEAANTLEEFWNDLGKIKSFSLLCAYYMDNLAPEAYEGPMQCICKSHSHLIPACDYDDFDEIVSQASKEVLGSSSAAMLQSLAALNASSIHMPLSQATLFYLSENMPIAADKVLARMRASVNPTH